MYLPGTLGIIGILPGDDGVVACYGRPIVRGIGGCLALLHGTDDVFA